MWHFRKKKDYNQMIIESLSRELHFEFTVGHWESMQIHAWMYLLPDHMHIVHCLWLHSDPDKWQLYIRSFEFSVFSVDVKWVEFQTACAIITTIWNRYTLKTMLENRHQISNFGTLKMKTNAGWTMNEYWSSRKGNRHTHCVHTHTNNAICTPQTSKA